MSQENVEVVQRGYAAFARGDMTSAVAEVDEDFIATRVAPMPDVRAYKGPEGLLQILADWVEGFDDFDMSAEEFIDANEEQVIARLHQSAIGAQSRVPIEADFWFVHTVRAGKLLRMDIYGSESQALEAAGLAE